MHMLQQLNIYFATVCQCASVVTVKTFYYYYCCCCYYNDDIKKSIISNGSGHNSNDGI